MQSVSALVVRAPLVCQSQVRSSGLRLLHDGVRFGSSKLSLVPRSPCFSAERGGNDALSTSFRKQLNWKQRGAATGAQAQNAGGEKHQRAEEQKEEKGLMQQKQGNGRGITREPIGGGGLLSPMIDDLWDPFFSRGSLSPARSISRMLDTMDRLFEDFSFTTMPGRTGAAERSILRTPFEMQRDEDAYHLRVDMPGLSKDEVKLQVEDGNILYIKGEHSEEKQQDQRFARSYGTYQTRLVLEDDADVTKIDAELKDGVLLITVPKKPEAKERSKTFEVAIK